MFPNDIGLDTSAQQRLQILVSGCQLYASQLSIGKVAQPRAEAEPDAWRRG
jgi:hypothetical protein